MNDKLDIFSLEDKNGIVTGYQILVTGEIVVFYECIYSKVYLSIPINVSPISESAAKTVTF